MNIFVLSFDVDGFINPAVTRLVRHGVLDAPRIPIHRAPYAAKNYGHDSITWQATGGEI